MKQSKGYRLKMLSLYIHNMLFRAKCVRCPWVLQQESSAHYYRIFSLSCPRVFCSLRRVCPRVQQCAPNSQKIVNFGRCLKETLRTCADGVQGPLSALEKTYIGCLAWDLTKHD
jgi:hypothetical protein